MIPEINNVSLTLIIIQIHTQQFLYKKIEEKRDLKQIFKTKIQLKYSYSLKVFQKSFSHFRKP